MNKANDTERAARKEKIGIGSRRERRSKSYKQKKE
jgi:hypothetical protein